MDQVREDEGKERQPRQQQVIFSKDVLKFDAKSRLVHCPVIDLDIALEVLEKTNIKELDPRSTQTVLFLLLQA